MISLDEQQKARIVFLAQSIELRALWLIRDYDGFSNPAVCRVSSEQDSAEACRIAQGSSK